MRTLGIVLLAVVALVGSYLAFRRVTTAPEREAASAASGSVMAVAEPASDSKTDATSDTVAKAARAEEESVVDVRIDVPAGALQSAGPIDVALVLSIDDGWHVNANPASDEYLIPTEIALAEDAPAKIVHVDYPPPAARKSLSYSEKPVDVYAGEVRIPVRLSVNGGSGNGISFLVTYQPCDDSRCLAPSTVTVTLPPSKKP